LPRKSFRIFLLLGSVLFILSQYSQSQTTRYIYSCGVLNQASTTYVLQNDVSTSGTCFSIQNRSITLDLNGKTVTYGSGGAATGKPRYGVLGITCWDTVPAADNPCGGYFDDLSVKNGTIVQAAGAGPYSHGIRLGQGSGKRLKVADVNIKVSSTSSLPIHTTYQYGADISGGTINNNVTVINNRHQVEGLSVRLSESLSGTAPDNVHGVTIVGGAQGGILLTVPNSVAYDNDISLLGTYTNDFGVYLWGAKSEARNNNIHGQSRGIHIKSTGNRAIGNTISVYEVDKNLEYKGCQVGGAFGIQHETTARSSFVNQNAVTVLANICEGRAARWTEVPAANGNLSQSNYYKASRYGTSTKMAIAASFSKSFDIVSDGDTFEADTNSAEIAWEGSSNILIKNGTFKKGTNPSSNYATFAYRGGTSAWATTTRFDSMTVQDPIFLNGASKDSVVMYPRGYNGWGVAASFTVQWTYRLKVVNSSGAAVSGATVTITDNKGGVVTATTDAYGSIPPTVLKEFVKYNTTTSVLKDIRSYTVKIVKTGACSKSVTLGTITGTKNVVEMCG